MKYICPFMILDSSHGAVSMIWWKALSLLQHLLENLQGLIEEGMYNHKGCSQAKKKYTPFNKAIIFLIRTCYHLRRFNALTNTCSAAVYSYFTENELESNLNREAFLYYCSGIFDAPSFFDALPFMIVGTRSARVIPSTGNVSFSKLQYWTITHPFLADDDNPRTSFRALCRMNLASFESLVNDLSQHPAFDLRAHNSIPAYIQISCAIWRLANCHLGYRMCNAGLGVSHGSYINFFRRTLIAIEGFYGRISKRNHQ
ncbi:hypothetical protein EDC94DRAFT_588237 [Helicostylum pulchrum]|nr:hypothetical protein EDC94DRAFT_588237 [Helicostylum pulchrum]